MLKPISWNPLQGYTPHFSSDDRLNQIEELDRVGRLTEKNSLKELAKIITGERD